MPIRFIHHLQISLPCYVDGHRLLGVATYTGTTSTGTTDSVNLKFNLKVKSNNTTSIHKHWHRHGDCRQFHSGPNNNNLKAPASLRVGNGNDSTGRYLNRRRRYPSLRLQQQQLQQRQRQERQEQIPNPIDIDIDSTSIESTNESRRLRPPQNSKSTSSFKSPHSSSSDYNYLNNSASNFNLSSPAQMASSTTITSTSFPELRTLFENNQQWAEDVNLSEPRFFKDGVEGQKPKVLWIGCADSRVPESVVTACRPGEIFVHRNIANQFHLQDDSALSVLAYAVESLGVKHVVVVGHTKCGGVAGAYKAAKEQKSNTNSSSTQNTSTPLSRWLTPLINLATPLIPHSETGNENEILPRLVEENVKRQVENVCSADVIVRAWAGGKGVYVHGWVYQLEDGRLKDLGVSKGPGA